MRLILFILDALILFFIGYVLTVAYIAGQKKGQAEKVEKLLKNKKKGAK